MTVRERLERSEERVKVLEGMEVTLRERIRELEDKERDDV